MSCGRRTDSGSLYRHRSLAPTFARCPGSLTREVDHPERWRGTDIEDRVGSQSLQSGVLSADLQTWLPRESGLRRRPTIQKVSKDDK